MLDGESQNGKLVELFGHADAGGDQRAHLADKVVHLVASPLLYLAMVRRPTVGWRRRVEHGIFSLAAIVIIIVVVVVVVRLAFIVIVSENKSAFIFAALAAKLRRCTVAVSAPLAAPSPSLAV